eukprot:1144767-Pelagomonas_calceolata.AAC.5
MHKFSLLVFPSCVAPSKKALLKNALMHVTSRVSVLFMLVESPVVELLGLTSGGMHETRPS